MTNVDRTTLRNILYLCKFIGIINISYILEPDGLLTQSTDTIYKCLEFTRMIALIMFTYYIHASTIYIYNIFILKLWSIIIASRLSETRVIQLMNGIIEYDQKLTSLPRSLLICKHSKKKNYWNMIFIFTLTYYIVTSLLFLHVWPPKTVDIMVIPMYFIRVDFIVDIALIFSTYFVLKQLEHRFQNLNDSWKYLLPGFLSVQGELTNSITGMTLEKIRLLHSDLSDLLRIFSVGYGQMLLGFFVFNYMHMLLSFYYIIHYDGANTEELISVYLIKTILPYIMSSQNVVLTISIIIAASRVHGKKRKMISHLRLIRISGLSTTLKLQIKLFMNQISILEPNEITAFGIFNINLNLVISIIILLITGLVTLIQLKEHPAMKKTVDNITNYLSNSTKGTFK